MDTTAGGIGDHLGEADRVLVLGRPEDAVAAAAAVGMTGRVIAVCAPGRALTAAEGRRRRGGWYGLELHEEGAALPAEDGSLDAVVIARSSASSRRRGALLCEVARVLRAGGRLLVADASGAAADWSTALPARP